MRYKLYLLFFLLSTTILSAKEFTIVSWNAKDFGRSRDANEMEAIANLLKDYDLIAIQEVVAKDPGGVQAVARLAAALSRKGADWDYICSEATRSPSAHISERYAFVWKKHRVKMKGKPVLLTELESEVHREPFVGQFEVGGEKLSIINYHSRTHNGSNDERFEIQQISKWIKKQSYENLIWAGDFNLEIDHDAFDDIKIQGFDALLHGEKTSLKRKCKEGMYLSSAEDNILFHLKTMKAYGKKVLDFVKLYHCEDVTWLRNSYSDHLPLVIGIDI